MLNGFIPTVCIFWIQTYFNLYISSIQKQKICIKTLHESGNYTKETQNHKSIYVVLHYIMTAPPWLEATLYIDMVPYFVGQLMPADTAKLSKLTFSYSPFYLFIYYLFIFAVWICDKGSKNNRNDFPAKIKQMYSLSKCFAPSGSKFFAYKIHPLLERDKGHFDSYLSP